MKDQPLYVRGTYFMLFIVLIVMGLYQGRPLLVPMSIALLLAFLALPITKKLESWNAPVWLAALVGVISILLIGVALFSLLSWQIMGFADDLPTLQEAISVKIKALNRYIESEYSISRREQSKWMEQEIQMLYDEAEANLIKFFTATGAFLTTLTLIPIFMFFTLLYRPKFKRFLQLLKPDQHVEIEEVFRKISQVSHHYIKGVIIEIAILTVLSSVGFMILGLKYAILLGLIVAVLNIVPYIGVLVGSFFPIAFALVTKESGMYALGAWGVCVVTQFFDNNFIAPNIVGSSVNLNPLASILALLMGGMLWGLPGMILGIPLAGVFKVICDNVDSLRALGFLLGEEREYRPFRLRVPGLRRPNKSE